MITLEQRLEAALGSLTQSAWNDLMRLYQNDAEAFYLIACDGATEPFHDLAFLASDVRSAIQESYEVENAGNDAQLVLATGKSVSIPKSLLPQVIHFLREVDGKTNCNVPGKDYVGAMASEAEMRFKLGDRNAWDADDAGRQARSAAKPFVLHLDDEEISHLASQPAYVTHGLLNCARKTVLAPTSVFKGLKRGDHCPSDLNEGWAFCGKPRQAFDNEGRAFTAPAGMVYMVYADESRFVFDWDWVKESPGEPGYPVDWQLRFGNPQPLQGDAALELPKDLRPGTLSASEACYSSRGDCIFCYMTDEVSHAIRINPDLTVFKSLNRGEYAGFKIKNVQRILEVDRTIEMTDAPGLSVSVAAVLLATLKRHPQGPDGDVQVYNVLIQALYQRNAPPPKVHVPHASRDLVEA